MRKFTSTLLSTIAFSFTAFSLLLSACNTSDVPDPRSIGNGKYDNKNIGLSLKFPSGWIFATDKKIDNTTADLVATGLPVNNYVPTVSVIFNDHKGSDDIADKIPEIKAKLILAYPDLKSLSDTTFLQNGKPVAKIKYNATVEGSLLRNMQVLIVNKGKDIVVTYTDKADHFESNADFKSIDASMSIY